MTHHFTFELFLSSTGTPTIAMNNGRTKLMNLVESGEIATLIIAHKDRLVRFGFEWFQYFCERLTYSK